MTILLAYFENKSGQHEVPTGFGLEQHGYAFFTTAGIVRPMPILPEHRFFYPIDWPQLSAVIRFGRARGCCEGCGRPHGRMVYHLGDGRWWDADAGR
jgi:hypothetical protein